MKKTLLPFLLILLSSVTLLQAQSALSFGPTVGINFATIGGKDADQLVNNLSSKTGLYIGGFMNYQFSDMFALQPEIAYSMKGATAANQGVNYTFTLNYIEIPVLLKFYIPIEGATSIKPSLYAGPAFAFNVASNVEATGNSQSQTVDLSSQTKGFDFGLAFGGGVGFNVGSGVLDFSLRYTLGMTSFDNSGNNLTLTNGAFSIIAGYAFSIQ